MIEFDFDDGLVHAHDWASDTGERGTAHPIVADLTGVNTPSCVFHDDAHHAP